MILSVGMIVKNEEKYLRQCLEALVPILNSIDSELIIADTGSTDNTINIAKEFTNEVFHFEWCNDFAAARNSTLERAKGKWFMSIDADEIIEDATELVEFFKSGMYKKYNCASYIIRSANDKNIYFASDFNAVRLIKRTNNIKYVNPIHESFSQVYGPIMYLPVVANHYGYITEENDDFIQAKMDRNFTLMFEEMDRKPENAYNYLNIANAYRMIKEYEKALEYCYIGLGYAKAQNNPILFSLYSNICSVLFKLEKHREILEEIENYFASKINPIGTDVEMYYLAAECHLKLNNYEESIKFYEKYVGFYIEYKQGKHNTIDLLQHSVNYIDGKFYRRAILCLAFLQIETENFTDAKKHLRQTPINELIDDKFNVGEWLSIELKLMKKQKDFTGLADLYLKLDDNSQEILQDLIEKGFSNKAYRELILNDFAKANTYKSNYICLMNLRNDYYSGNLNINNIKVFISKIGKLSPVYADVIYLALVSEVSVDYISEQMDSYDLYNLFLNNNYFNFEDLHEKIMDICKDNTDYEDIKTHLWVTQMLGIVLTSDKLDTEQTVFLFKKYSNMAIQYLLTVFKEEILCEDNVYLLPKRLRAGYYCYLASESLKSGEGAKYIELLRIILDLRPTFKNTIEILTTEFQKQIEEEDKRSTEFEMYAAQVKQTLYGLIENNQIEDAKEILRAYEELCPNDSEIDIFRSKLRDYLVLN